jgi:uncharacterized phage-associated protein
MLVKSHNDTKLVEAPFQAWEYGPVSPPAYNFLDGVLKRGLPVENLYLTDFDQETQAVYDYVMGKYGDLSGVELSDKTHEEAPWKNSYVEGQKVTLPDELLYSFYSNK